LDATWLVWGIYCLAIAVVFAIIKLINFRLHYMFDTTEVTEEKEGSEKKESSDKDSKTVIEIR